MITSKQRAELRGKANELDTTLMVGKEGVTPSVIAQAENQLEARELIKGKVLETALMTAREASDAICQATGAEGIQAVGAKFVIYRQSEKPAAQAAKAKKKVNPVRQGVQKRRRQAKEARQQRREYFREAAVQQAIARRKEERED